MFHRETILVKLTTDFDKKKKTIFILFVLL